MQKWKLLKPGDIIDVVAPGYATKPEVLERAIIYLERQGFKPRVPVDLLAPSYFHSNTDAYRFAHLKKALLAKDSKAVWCLRGGYGSNRLLPMLSKIKKPKNFKILIGISDITSLHVFLNQKWGWITLHGTLLDRLGEGQLPPHIEKETFSILFGEQNKVVFNNLKPLNDKATKIKKISAAIVGGNLSVLESGIGTPYSIKLKNKFLFIEDIGERGYRVDRMLEHLKQANILKDCKGILVGQFVGGEESTTDQKLAPSRWFEAIQRFAIENPKLPLWTGIETGHDVNLRTLPLGSKADIVKINGEISLIVESGSC